MTWTVLTIIYMAMVMIGSLQPNLQEIHPSLLKEMLHNLMHVPAYTIMALFVFAAVDGWGRKIKLVPVVAFVALYGAFIEVLQGFAPGRTSSFLDVLLNTCGALLAVVVVRSDMLVFPDGQPRET